MTSNEQRLITKDNIAAHAFQYSDTLVIKKIVLSWNSYSDTTSQSISVSFVMHTARPLLKLKLSILLVMYS